MATRIFDIIISLAGIVILLPALVAVILLIGLTSGSPIFFRQTRVGKGGRTFILFKFRSMVHSPRARTESFAPGRRDRITSVGRILRTYKIDEWPQLFNVLKGDMSIVGPRPEVEEWTRAYPERWEAILRVKPGITDPASIYYLKEEDMLSRAQDPVKRYRDAILPSKLAIYEEYIRSRSFLGDIKVIMRTLTSVLKI
jgi:lipopolysaccharide/colanic/teichoic acid biosynthesis glycosyltransferase